MLHIISNIKADTINQCIEAFDENDCIVFLIDDSFNQEELKASITTITKKGNAIHTVLCRSDRVPSWPNDIKTSLISYEEFVLLCTLHTPIQTWY